MKFSSEMAEMCREMLEIILADDTDESTQASAVATLVDAIAPEIMRYAVKDLEAEWNRAAPETESGVV